MFDIMLRFSFWIGQDVGWHCCNFSVSHRSGKENGG
jgi:hypothetical protein